MEMKLLRAEFNNFRLLRDLELIFSTDPDKRLTVIRAANESGKTTILHGLQWALYGDDALPGKGKSFRLHPIDWDKNQNEHVSITVTVDFEVVKYRRTDAEPQKIYHRFRIVRSASEYTNSKEPRSASTVKLYELKNSQQEIIDEPEALISKKWPIELKNIFFTDGDRALSFIEAEDSPQSKRIRVRDATRSLLSLSLIDDAMKHVKVVKREVNKEAKQLGTGSEFIATVTELEELDKKREKLEKDLENASQQLSNVDKNIFDTERKIDEVLEIGDEHELRKQRKKIRRELKQLEEQTLQEGKDHSRLFRSPSIASGLLAGQLKHVMRNLENLHNHDQISSATIPVLEARLEVKKCICGETLERHHPDGEKRREHIHQLIRNNEKDDHVKKILTDLYFETRHMSAAFGDGETINWVAEYKGVKTKRTKLQNLIEITERKCEQLGRRIDLLPDTSLQELRKVLQYHNKQRGDLLQMQAKYETQLYGLNKICKDLEIKRKRLLREQRRGAQILAKIEVIEDVLKVMESAQQYITGKVLQEVSESMNDVFLKMIGADYEQYSKQQTIIQRAEISPEFDIVVYGPEDRKLDPDRDLNGASRRALTLAFILALTKVSGVTAPNTIDTPLGMTSGYVRCSILQTVVRESAQLILFLTHDEISGCENIIDQAAGVVITLTNSAHYPKILVNPPPTDEREIIRCECNHRNYCRICQRHHGEERKETLN